ncbi:hypothetical protein [Thermogemmatispora sp.]|uniref:hypothetical protein n=1 Tax=Thermogemmatispora sp. TaxID=1968838 RepID=UPI001D215BEE|nr:hypothetical protein [Thermogemmatispora sp.]MBX5451425.1 hypothetical protein [Thermogemmatispora sp.]
MPAQFSSGAGFDADEAEERQTRWAIPCRQQGIPAFTEEDVRTYVAEHPPLYTMFGAVPAVGTVRFLSSAEAASLLRQWRAGPALAALPPEKELVCLVELVGPFQIRDPLRPLGRVAPIASRLYLVINAGNGSLLTWVPVDQ